MWLCELVPPAAILGLTAQSNKTKEAAENIPLVPKFEFIAALVGDASAGGVALEKVKKIMEALHKAG